MSSPINPRIIGSLSRVARTAMRPTMRTLWPTQVRGRAHLPELGPAILAPNHLSEFDSALLLGAVHRTVTFLGKAEYLDDWTTRWLFPAVGMIPVDRAGGREAQAALDAATARLDRGEFVGIYPEGTRSRDGHLHRGKTGVARLALRTGAPIIPVGIRGTDRIQPCDQTLPSVFANATITFGKPVHPDAWMERLGEESVHREITDTVMMRIRAITGQRYIDSYAGNAVTGPRIGAEVMPTEDVEPIAS
ncbi:MAG: lysophospholipid acyltransferase family protein [Actinomycetota bacterium]